MTAACVCDPQRPEGRPWYAHQPGCPLRDTGDGGYSNLPAKRPEEQSAAASRFWCWLFPAVGCRGR